MSVKRTLSMWLIVALLCVSFSACGKTPASDSTDGGEVTTTTVQDVTEPTADESSQADPTPVDIKTGGGVVIVGKIDRDDQGWYMQPEQPLNITFTYFEDNPKDYEAQTRIKMFDPEVDGVEKTVYLGQTVTVYGTFTYYRDDFETLYLTPYSVVIGKNAAESYADPTLMPRDEPENLYDPSRPLPKRMDAVIEGNGYTYNAFMLSREALEFMGNDFADFYVDFVDAFLGYKTEIPCPDKRFAEMLSMVIYYEFPLYNACAEPFEFYKHYDAENGTVTIKYTCDEEEFKRIKDKIFATADTLLASVTTDQTEEEKAKAIYHALCPIMTYDDSALEIIERKESYYAYRDHTGVCITFANMYNQMLTQVGIDTSLASCDMEVDGHVWSIVTIDDQQYFCDPTYELSFNGGNGYRYFGMNYADRIADGTGERGIYYGRYQMMTLGPESIAAKSLW